MTRITIMILFFFVTLTGKAQDYTPVDEGSKVHFSIKNFGISTGGDMAGLKGNIHFDPANLPSAEFNVSVDVKTINTDSRNRDEHLTSDSYFDADKFPVVLIKSTEIITRKSRYYFTGTLNMHGITKSISFPFSVTPQANGYLFAGEFEINRLDYSVGRSSAVLGDVVKVSLSVLARKG